MHSLWRNTTFDCKQICLYGLCKSLKINQTGTKLFKDESKENSAQQIKTAIVKPNLLKNQTQLSEKPAKVTDVAKRFPNLASGLCACSLQRKRWKSDINCQRKYCTLLLIISPCSRTQYYHIQIVNRLTITVYFIGLA